MIKKPPQSKLLPILFSLAFTVFIPSTEAFAAIELTTEVDDLNPSFGGRVTYTATLTGGSLLPEITPPDFNGFEIIMGPSTSTNIQMINGRMAQSKSLTYVLRAIKSGSVIIGPAKAIRKRKTYATSNSIELTVGGPSSPQISAQQNEDQDVIPGSSDGYYPEVFIIAEADKDKVYKQEMVIIKYRLYMRVSVTGYEITKLPTARGFWTEEFNVPSRPTLQDVTVRGRPYKMAVLRKTALFPTRTGQLTVEPIYIDCQIQLPPRRQSRRSRDPFQWFFDEPFGRRTETRSVSTEPLTLTVLDLPVKGCPANFKGDVGDFQLNVTYDKRELSQHDALTVKVTISGNGYLKSIDPPMLELPSGFEQFDPTIDDNITLTGSDMKGRKTFTYLVIPRRSGTFNLEPVQFSYFNPSTGRYHQLREGGRRVTVTPAEGELVSGNWMGKSEVTLLDSDIRFIKELKTPLTATTKPIYNSIWFFLALGFSPLLYILGLGTEAVIIRRSSDPDALRRRKAPEKMRKDLNSAKKAARRGNLLQAIDIAGRGLTDLAGAVIYTPAAGLTTDTLRDLLTKAEADPELVDEVVELILETDRIRFSGIELDAETIESLLNRFKQAANRLEKIR